MEIRLTADLIKRKMPSPLRSKSQRTLQTVLSRMILFVVKGRLPTLNTWLSGTSWRTKNREKSDWQTIIFLELLRQKIPKPLITPLTITATQFRVRPLDVDNSILAVKFLLDALKTSGYIPDDAPDNIIEIILRSRKCAAKEERTEFEIRSASA